MLRDAAGAVGSEEKEGEEVEDEAAEDLVLIFWICWTRVILRRVVGGNLFERVLGIEFERS